MRATKSRTRRWDREPRKIAPLSIAAAVAIGPLFSIPAAATTELTPGTFDSTVKSGRNGMVRYFQSWCGHSIRMKPDWDRLASELEGDPSGIFIGDVNCGNHKVLCDMAGVTGYPTVRYYLDGKEYPYDGGRGFEALLGFVREELDVRCDVNAVAETCSEKAGRYVDKWRGRDGGALKKEIDRLQGMEGGDMTIDLKGWVRERASILGQLISSKAENKENKNAATTMGEEL